MPNNGGDAAGKPETNADTCKMVMLQKKYHYFYFMLANFSGIRLWLWILAIFIVIASLLLSNFLAKKISSVERQRIEQWVAAIEESANPDLPQTNLGSMVMTENNKDIPIIFANEKDSIIDVYNLDSFQIRNNKDYLPKKLDEFRRSGKSIVWVNPMDKSQKNFVYYGESSLLKQIKYFPLVQLLVVALFIAVTLYAINTKNKSTQNLVWAGMAKEAAHQLGTPITSLQGWVEILRENENTESIATEMVKDVERLKLVSDRFGKIGSKPHLEETNLVAQLHKMVDYISRRAPDKVHFEINTQDESDIPALINPPLFDWVIENLLKNALDSMEGKGTIKITVNDEPAQIAIDIRDSGKGIPKYNFDKIFKPGFSTKQRGWGLGLSLSKRIMEEYHKGGLFIKNSELGRGTTFRVILRK